MGKGEAVLRAHNLRVRDYHDFANAASLGPSDPATVSFEVRWFDVLDRNRVVNEDQGFKAHLVQTNAQMEWSARVGNYRFESAPLETSSSAFAEIGHEHNGSFFKGH